MIERPCELALRAYCAAGLARRARAVTGQADRMIRSFDGLGPDDFLESYERFEDEAIARELAADTATGIADELEGQFTLEDLQ